MYKRDFGILALTAFAVYFALQNEGTFTFKKAWYYPLWAAEAPVSPNAGSLPKPVVVDLNGDGSLEIVAVTHDHRLVVLKGRGVSRESGFAKAQLMAEVSLRPAGIHTLNDPRPVALAAGYIDPPSKDLVHRPRKAIIVVMTGNWRLICFDHNLNTLWTKDIRQETHGNADIDEAAIIITHHAIHQHDRGLIVAGGTMNVMAKMEEEADEEEYAFETETEEEKHEEAVKHKLGEGEQSSEIHEGQEMGVDISREFSYYAFEGGKGHNRWQHVGSAFKRDLESLSNDLLPQRSHKVIAEHLSVRDYSEVSCRDYRESILHNLPHQWYHRTDTQLTLSHFVKHKTGKGAQKSKLAEKDRTASKSPCIGKNCKKDAVAKTIGDVSNKATKDGRSGFKTPDPNAIVAHLREGIQAIHLYTGRSLCKLPFFEGGLHVDLNGDGVPDHLQSTSGGETHHTFPHCYAYATSGIPPNEAYFNGSICRNAWADAFSHAKDAALMQPNYKSLDVAPPSMLPIPTPRGESTFRYGKRGYALYLNNRGDVTAFNSRGRVKWMASTDCTWYNPKISSYKSTPTLKPFPLRNGAFPTAILAAGSHSAEVLSEHGNQLAAFSLPETAKMALEIVDVNGDGLNDVLLISNRMVYGYVQVLNLGGRPFGMLVLCLIVAMGTIYASQWTGGETKTKIKRSTDRTD